MDGQKIPGETIINRYCGASASLVDRSDLF